MQQIYLYGNYIDEVLFKAGYGGSFYYVHDHLYSPVALIDGNDGSVDERYEYDAYGKVTVFTNMNDWNGQSPTTQSCSAKGNPYTFTGRRLDIFDSGNIEIIGKERGYPKYIRSDNGPEFISHSFRRFCCSHRIRHRRIEPGKPQQNSYIERFNRSYREDILDMYAFRNLQQVRDLSSEWQIEYNYDH